MATACIPQITFGFEPKGKPVVARFDQPHASSDGGAVLLKSLDTQLGLTERLAGCLADTRQPGKVQHQTLRVGAAARLRARLWLRRLQRRRAAGPRPDPQAAARPRSARGPGPGLAADAVAVRERRGAGAVARHGARAGRHGHRDPAAAAQGAGHADHDRPRPHRRPDPRPAGVHLLQRPLRHVVLPAGGGDGDVQRRGRAVCGGRGAAAGQRAGHAGGAGAPAAPAGQAARRLPRRRRFGSGWTGALPIPKLFQFLEQQQVEYVVAMASNRAPGEARAAADGQSADAVQGHRRRRRTCMARRGTPPGSGSASGG